MANCIVVVAVIMTVALFSVAIGDGSFYVANSVIKNRNYYWINDTKADLVCKPHDDATELSISEVQPTGRKRGIIIDGKMNSELDDASRYSYHMKSEVHYLSIQGPVDLSQYYCRWNYDPWYCWRILRCKYISEEKHVHFRVIESSEEHDDNCTLLNDISRKPVYFVGDNLTFSCSKEDLEISVMDGISFSSVQPDIETIGGEYLLTIRNINSALNGSEISCREDGGVEDYCEHFPAIVVYESIDVTITSSTLEVPKGDSLTVACQSEIYELASIEWDILGDINFSDATRQNITDGEQFLFTNVDISTSISVVCVVTIGSRSNNANVTIHRKIHSATRSGPPVIPIVIPVVTILIIFLIITAIIFRRTSFWRRTEAKSKASSSGEGVPPGDSRHNSDVYYNNDKKIDRRGTPCTEPEVKDSNAHYVNAYERVRLGLAQGDYEVADNVAYVSYD